MHTWTLASAPVCKGVPVLRPLPRLSLPARFYLSRALCSGRAICMYRSVTTYPFLEARVVGQSNPAGSARFNQRETKPRG